MSHFNTLTLEKQSCCGKDWYVFHVRRIHIRRYMSKQWPQSYCLEGEDEWDDESAPCVRPINGIHPINFTQKHFEKPKRYSQCGTLASLSAGSYSGNGETDGSHRRQYQRAACDAYGKTKLFVKVVNGLLWDNTLVKFLARFDSRREQLEFRLNIYSKITQGEVLEEVGQVKDIATEVNNKWVYIIADCYSLLLTRFRIDQMLAAFQTLASPLMRKLSEMVKMEGGHKEVIEQLLCMQIHQSHASAAAYPSNFPWGCN